MHGGIPDVQKATLEEVNLAKLHEVKAAQHSCVLDLVDPKLQLKCQLLCTQKKKKTLGIRGCGLGVVSVTILSSLHGVNRTLGKHKRRLCLPS